MGKYAHALRLPIMRRPDPRRHEYRASPPFFLSPAWGTHSLPGAYAAGRTSPRSGPEGRALHAAPLTTRNLDGPRARAESGILCIGSILCSRGPTKPHINGRASHTPQLVQTKARVGSLILPCGNLAPCGHLKKQGSFPLSGGGIGRRGEMFGKPRS